MTEQMIPIQRSMWNSTTLAAVALVIAVCGLFLGALSIRHQQTSDRVSRDKEHAARIASCIESNKSRIGGRDYARPLIREGWRRHGDDDLAEKYADIPKLDCKTGKPLPLPEGSQKP